MRARTVWQYGLILLGWILAIVALPLPGAEVNGFLTWRGHVSTQGFIQWIFALPESVAHDWHNPALRAAFAFGDVTWLAGVLLGFIFFVFAPTLVRRRNSWSHAGRTVICCVSSVLLILPLTFFAPPHWSFPITELGVDLLGVAHVLVYIALILTPARSTADSAFPVLQKAL